MNILKIADGLLGVVEKLAPALEGLPSGAVVLAAKALLELVDEVGSALDEKDAEALRNRRDEFEPLVMAHLGRTIASLG